MNTRLETFKMQLNEIWESDCTHTAANQKPVKLFLNNTEIKSIQELRENFNSEEILKAFISHDLHLWLSQHYYDMEAKRLCVQSINTPDCLKNICEILGVSYYNKAISTEEKAKIDARRKIVQEFTNDPVILSELELVATNQEELAELLDRREKKIYLCNESFSVPIRIGKVTYIGIGNAVIENPFTAEQYAKAGISVSGISLPADANPDTEWFALTAARLNGYDDFADNHTPFSTAFYNHLKTRKYQNSYYFPCDNITASTFYTSKYECEQAREKAVHKIYDDATRYITTGNAKSISKEAVQNYDNIISSVFTSEVLQHLESISNMTHTAPEYARLKQLVSNSHKNLLSAFEAELNDSCDYYAMYDFHYFVNQTEIEEHDYRIGDNGVIKALETLLTDHLQYTISNLFSVVSEIEKDLNAHAATFFNAAFRIYCAYYTQIAELLDAIGKDLTRPNENESLTDYLIRMCAAKAS